MKTIEINLYSFDELSEGAKKKALENWSIETEYFGGDEAIESLTKFAEHFNSKLVNYSIDWNNSTPGTFAKFEVPYEDLTKKELRSLILSMGSYNKKTLRGHGDCKFTGVCFDEDCCDGARKAYFDGERDLNAILQAGFDSLFKSCINDFEAQQTIEYFSDHADANEYTFEADGTMNNG